MSTSRSESSNTALKSTAVVAGAAAGAVAGIWTSRKVREFANQERPDSMINWERSRTIAVRMNREAALTAAEREALDAYYRDLVSQCIPIVSQYTGATLPNAEQQTFAFDRVDWIQANLEGFQRMLDPLEALNASSRRSTFGRFMGGVNQTVLSYEVGLLLGYMARRVLGQYDLALLGREPVQEAGKLYFVEPNIRNIEKSLNLPSEDFRMWLSLHETTHAFEFEAYPWVKEYFNDLLGRYLGFMRKDAENAVHGNQGMTAILKRIRDGDAERGSWIESFMTEEQHQVFSQMQAMMCVIEGYSNHVMNAVGETLLPNYQLISQRFAERQANRTRAEIMFARLTGLDVKMEQYRAGERFIDQIVEKHGHHVAAKVWDGPQNLPTMDEIRNPEAWVSRIEQPVLAAAQ